MRTIKTYYSMVTGEQSTDIYIYGDITSFPWLESDVSAYSLASVIEGLETPQINVYINSYGGETAEGLAIHNALVRHSAKVATYCDGFACSAASVVFMAGDDRYMYPASLLMIHNAWTMAVGNADELRKEADDLEKISDTATQVYKRGLSISDEELAQKLDAETWINPEEALEWGFATAIVQVPATARASQSVRQSVVKKLVASLGQEKPEQVIDSKELGAAESEKVVHEVKEKMECDKKEKQSKYFNFKEERN